MKPITRVLSVFMAMCMILSSYGTMYASAFGVLRRFEISNMLPEHLDDVVSVSGVEDIKTDGKKNEVTLEMTDGSYTTYTFTEDVWYESNEGMRFKELKVDKQDNSYLKEQGYAYSNGDNDYSINFSESVKKRCSHKI